MYKIEYYTNRGCFVCKKRFRTVREATKYARKNRESLGVHYIILSA